MFFELQFGVGLALVLVVFLALSALRVPVVLDGVTQNYNLGAILTNAGKLDDAIHRTGELGVEVDLRPALGQVLDHPVAGGQRHFGHDAAHGLDQVEVRVVERQLRVELEQRARE